MASRRMLWKKISLCPDLADVSELAALAFTWAIPHACDWGTLPGNSRVFRALVFPLRDDLSVEAVETALGELIDAGLFTCYDADGSTMLHFVEWEKHQDIRKRTDRSRPTLPGDPEATDTLPGNSGKAPESPENSEPREVKRSEEKGSKKEGASNGDALPVDTSNEQPDQTIIRECYEAYTKGPMLKGEKRRGYAGLRTLLEEVGHELAEEWRDHLKDLNGSQVKRGSKDWPNFSKAFRASMNQPWNWKEDVDPPHSGPSSLTTDGGEDTEESWKFE